MFQEAEAEAEELCFEETKNSHILGDKEDFFFSNETKNNYILGDKEDFCLRVTRRRFFFAEVA